MSSGATVPKSALNRHVPKQPSRKAASGEAQRVEQSNQSSGERAERNDGYLLTQRDLLILVITFIVGGLAAVVAGLTLAIQTAPDLGSGPAIALGIASGVVALVMTGLVVANRLHKLVR
jgi:hypothetical protein